MKRAKGDSINRHLQKIFREKSDYAFGYQRDERVFRREAEKSKRFHEKQTHPEATYWKIIEKSGRVRKPRRGEISAPSLILEKGGVSEKDGTPTEPLLSLPPAGGCKPKKRKKLR